MGLEGVWAPPPLDPSPHHGEWRPGPIPHQAIGPPHNSEKNLDRFARI